MAFLACNNIIDAVLTEDSDLITFGCQTVIYKSRLTGECLIYERSKLKLSVDFNHFRRMCILSGCDYLQGGMKGIGLTKAEKLLSKNFQLDDEEFQKNVNRAEITFLHQIIFDPIERIQRPLTNYFDDLSSINFVGEIVPQQEAIKYSLIEELPKWSLWK